MKGDENPWPVFGSVPMFQRVSVPAGRTDRLGWNAIPLALEDLDSNCAREVGQLPQLTEIKRKDGVEMGQEAFAAIEGRTLVSMFGEDCILTSWPEPHWTVASSAREK